MALSPGDIAFIAYNSDTNKIFTFVALVNIAAGEVIKFTDNGWTAAGAFRANEGTITWTAPTGGVSAGTIVTINSTSAVTATTGTVTETPADFNLSTGGDQILAYQGADTTPTFIAAINNEGAGAFQTDAINANTSALPTGLTIGTDAVALDEVDNAKYNGTVLTGTKAELLAAINNKANWTLDDVNNQIFSGTFSVGGGGADTTAPTIAALTPADNSTGFVVGNNLQIQFSENVQKGTTGDIVIKLLNGDPVETFTVNSSLVTVIGNTVTINPTNDLIAGTEYYVEIAADAIEDIAGNDFVGISGDSTWNFTTAPAAGTPTLISAIQGSGTVAIAGTYTIEGIVVGDFQGPSQLGGFYLQEEDTDADGNVLTSEAIFVSSSTAVNVGDKVSVTGTVSESFNQSIITPTTVSVSVTGQQALVTATTVDLPTTVLGDLERYEGMLITIPQTLTVTEVFNLGRFGEISLSANGRLFNPTNFIDPNDALATGTNSSGASNVAAVTAQQNLNDRSRIILDDGSSASNLSDVPYIDTTDASTLNDTLRIGSTIAGLTGVLGFGFGEYRIQATQAPVINYEARPDLPIVGGSVKVGSFNVLNYFNGDGSGGGFPTSRGADTLVEFNRQRAKIISAIKELNADVVGLIEMENDGDGPNSAIADLVNGLNAAMGAGTYAFVPLANTTGNPGNDEIKVAFIYKPGVLSLVGNAVYFNDSAFNTARPPLAQTFSVNATGEKFTPIINHFKSKGSSAGLAGDADQGDGQGLSNATRKAQATALLNFAAQIQTTSGDSDVMILGDLNAYNEEDPIDILRAGGYTKLATATDSYVFDGQTGSLDHALVSSSLLAQVTGAAKWNINSSEPIALDYNTEFGNDTTLYSADPFRSSDHDPVLVGLDIGTPTASLSGLVYVDANNDGIADANESRLAGITITITGTASNGNAVNRTTTTATNGTYQFNNLFSGNYTIAETQIAGYDDGTDTVGNLGGTLANDTFGSIAVAAGANGTGYNFGNRAKQLPPPVINTITTQTAASGGSTLSGAAGTDFLVGKEGIDTLIGNGGRDRLTGGASGDTFRYLAFTDSLFTNVSTNNQLDNITDFNQADGDRIQINAFTPANLFYAGAIAAANLQAALLSVYGDRNPLVAGSQALDVNEAVFFTFGTRTYLTVNDGTAGFSNSTDLVIDPTNIKYKTGDNIVGSLTVSDYFS